jgi:NitT/TauT family transport system permease protein
LTADLSKSRVIAVAAPVACLALFYGLWQGVVVWDHIQPLLLPTPNAILEQAWDAASMLVGYTGHTAAEAAIGLGCGAGAAIVVGVLVHRSSLLSTTSTVLAAAGRALPSIVLYPVVTVFLSTGSAAVELIIAIGIFPIIFTYVLNGLRQVSELTDVMHVAGASRMRTFASMRLPLAMPYLITGIKTCLPIAVIAAVIAEYFGGATDTIGTYIRLESTQLHTVELWSAIVYACLLGIVAFILGSAVDRYLLRWHSPDPRT